MHPPGAGTVLVRHGEIGTKSGQVQARMEQHLAGQVRAVIDDRRLDASVEREHSRLYLHTTGDIEAVTAAVTDCFGVLSASPALSAEPTMPAITEALTATAVQSYDGGTFAVRARRAGPADAHPFDSTDIEEKGGEAIWAAASARGVDPAVDLERPDHTFSVECRPDRALVFTETVEGPGGLPLGTQEPLVALVSGGIDSPVAAWLAMKRGCPVYPLYVDLGAYGGVDHRLRAGRTVSQLAAYAPDREMPLRVAPGGEGVERIVASTDGARMPVWRRFLYRVAEAVATDLGAVGIVSGESIGQKSSQTSANIRAAGAVTTLPVHRPVLSMDKHEITGLARDIGTYAESTMDAGCYRLAPDNPTTRPSPGTVRDAEPEGIAELATTAADAVETIDDGGEGGTVGPGTAGSAGGGPGPGDSAGDGGSGQGE
jgi:thiamine biosynthesis protein ThiI